MMIGHLYTLYSVAYGTVIHSIHEKKMKDDSYHQYITCARWNRTTGPLSPYRFEACTHHQAGSCTHTQSLHLVTKKKKTKVSLVVPTTWGRHESTANNNINANAVPVPSNAMGGGIVDDPGWEDNFHSLIRYKMEHGHCKVCILCLLAVYAHILCSSSTILLFYCFTGSSSIQGGSKVGTLGNDTA